MPETPTMQALTRLVLDANLERLVEALAPLDEAQRAELEAGVELMASQVFADPVPGFAPDDGPEPMPEDLRRVRQMVSRRHWQRIEMGMRLALVAVLRQARMKNLALWSLEGKEEDYFVRVLADRRPEWLQPWFEKQFHRGLATLEWRLGRRMVLEGLVDRPTTEGWIQAMVRDRAHESPDRALPGITLYRRLADMPDVLEHDFWRLFQVPTDARSWYPDTYGLARGDTGEVRHWGPAVVRLVERGHVGRGRVLDRLLAALGAEMPNRLLGAFVRLYRELRPSTAEAASRQRAYLPLLRQGQSTVVGLALEELTRLERESALDPKRLLEPTAEGSEADDLGAALASVFGRKAKNRALEALDLLGCLVHPDPPPARTLVDAVRAALEHPARPVRERARELLDRVAPTAPTPTAPTPTATTPTATTDSSPDEPEADHDSAAPQLADLARRAARFEPARLVDLGLDAEHFAPLLAAADDALEDGVETGDERVSLPLPPPLSITATETLARATFELGAAIEPIADPHALLSAIDRISHGLDSALEIERLLDGLSRFADRRPEGEDRQPDRLEQRSKALLGSTIGAPILPRTLEDAILAWLGAPRRGSAPPRWPGSDEDAGVSRFYELRLRELATRVLDREPRPLLAAPTHAGGWIAPAALVERLGHWLEAEKTEPSGPARPSRPDRADLFQALLRLAPIGRGEALAKIRARWPEAGRREPWDESLAALVFALGGELDPDRRLVDAPLWLTAARTRAPSADFEQLAERLVAGARRAGAHGPDGLRAARWSWHIAFAPPPREPDGPPRPALRLQVEPPLDGTDERSGALHAFAADIASRRSASTRGHRGVDRLHPHGPRIEAPAVTLHRTPTPPPLRHAAPWRVEWALTAWPAAPDALLASGLPYLLARRNERSKSAAVAYLECLRSASLAWNEVRMLVLWCGLLGREPRARQAAIEILVAGLGDGRGHPVPLGRVLARLCRGNRRGETDSLGTSATEQPAGRDPGWVEPERLADGLLEIAAASPWHALVAACWLDFAVGTWADGGGRPPRGAHRLLDAWLQLAEALAIGVPSDSPSRAVLAGLRGRTKAAQLARRLLRLAPSAASPATLPAWRAQVGRIELALDQPSRS